MPLCRDITAGVYEYACVLRRKLMAKRSEGMMGERSKTEDEFVKEGWTKRFVTNEPRLSEAVELYRSMGYEVDLEPLPVVDCDSSDEESRECRACFKGFEGQYKIIYTRPQKGKAEEGDLR